MVTHKWPPATKSSVVLARDVERHLSETITATTLGRHPQQDTLCSWCFIPHHFTVDELPTFPVPSIWGDGTKPWDSDVNDTAIFWRSLSGKVCTT
jgi:hypothetical protein